MNSSVSRDMYKDSLMEIFNNFKHRSNRGSNNVINLRDVESYFLKMKSMGFCKLGDGKDIGCSIFENKIKRVPEDRKIMEQSEFLQYFSQDVSNVLRVRPREIILMISLKQSILMAVSISAKKS